VPQPPRRQPKAVEGERFSRIRHGPRARELESFVPRLDGVAVIAPRDEIPLTFGHAIAVVEGSPRPLWRQRRLTGVDEMVLSLSAKGLTHGEIAAHLAEVYGANVSKQTISTITDQAMDGMAEWQSRPLDPIYPVVFVDAINVKVRNEQVANRPVYVALAVTVEGTREILGIWAGDGGEGAKHWLQVFTELKNRGVSDVVMLVCDGLKGLPDPGAAGWPRPDVQTSTVHLLGAVWARTIVQTCMVHLLRNRFR